MKKNDNISLLEISVVGEVLIGHKDFPLRGRLLVTRQLAWLCRLRSIKSKLDDFTNKLPRKKTIVVIFRESFHILYEQCIH